MSRFERYGTRNVGPGSFNHWHRYAFGDDAKLIDLDGCGYCHVCGMLLYVIESARDVGQSNKPTTVTNAVARGLQVPAWLVLATPGTCECSDVARPGCQHGISAMRVARTWPRPTGLVRCEPGSFAAMVQALRDSHLATVCADAVSLGITPPRPLQVVRQTPEPAPWEQASDVPF